MCLICNGTFESQSIFDLNFPVPGHADRQHVLGNHHTACSNEHPLLYGNPFVLSGFNQQLYCLSFWGEMQYGNLW
jgi:hypothetical protein